MTIPLSNEEYQAQLNEKLNWFERLADGASGLDERVDVTNKLLIELVKTSAIGAPGEIGAKLDAILTVLNLILVRLGGVAIMIENPPDFSAQKKIVKTAGTAINLPDVAIPYDHEAIIKASNANGGVIYIGNTKIEAEDAVFSYPLEPGQAIGYKISNLNHIWVNAATSGDSIVWTVEQSEKH